MNKKIAGIVGTIIVVITIAVFVLLKKDSSNSTQQLAGKSTNPNSTYTLAQVSSHSSSSSCWMVISGNVYDVTSYIPAHPNAQILDGCGKDATDMFNSVGKHMGRASSMLSDYLIGTLSN